MWKKQISTIQMCFASIGGILGSGWLLGPFYAARVAGPASIFSWLFGGCLMLFVALCFAELASFKPLPGGTARYAHLTHGTLCSFIIAWIAYLAAVVVPSIETMAAVQYASNYVPGLIFHHGESVQLTYVGMLLCAGTMLLLCIINRYSVRVFAKSSVWIVCWKIVLPLISSVVLLTHSFHPSNFLLSHEDYRHTLQDMLRALPASGIIFSFIGYSPAIQLAAEAKNPQQALPRAIIGAIVLAILIYCLVEFAFISALPSALLHHGWRHLHFSNDAGPFAGLMALVGVGWFAKVIYIDASFNPLGTSFIYTASTARLGHAISSNGYFPVFLQKLNKYGSPEQSIWLNYVVGLIFFLPFPGWQQMVGFIIVCFILSYVIGPIAVMVLRQNEGDSPRPFRLPCLSLISFIAFVVCGCLVFWTGWHVVMRMMIVIAIGLLYLFVYRLVAHVSESLEAGRAMWLLIYLAGLAVISYAGTIGGGRGVLLPGWDVLVITLFSACIWRCALLSAFSDMRF